MKTKPPTETAPRTAAGTTKTKKPRTEWAPAVNAAGDVVIVEVPRGHTPQMGESFKTVATISSLSNLGEWEVSCLEGIVGVFMQDAETIKANVAERVPDPFSAPRN